MLIFCQPMHVTLQGDISPKPQYIQAFVPSNRGKKVLRKRGVMLQGHASTTQMRGFSMAQQNYENAVSVGLSSPALMFMTAMSQIKEQ